ncbi:MAG: hypothetical protein OSA21_07470 [Candidatus Poseidoniaceae archaeon]|nr:hypothetical protein [Candidatus Poseidoniaceae archaeon]
MDNNASTLENLNFAELKPSAEKNEQSTWAEKSTTLYAHPSGKLPSRFAAVGWQPWHRPGSSGAAVTSTTIARLTRRSQIAIRGEA